MRVEEVKLRVGKYRMPGKLHSDGKRIYFEFPYWPALNEEIKMMEGRKYHGFEPNGRKWWSIPITVRNLFQLDYLRERNPYARFDTPLVAEASQRPLYKHQLEAKAFMKQRRHGIYAGEMGVGKSLAAGEAAEEVLIDSRNQDGFWWVAPKSALMSVRYDFHKWRLKVWPEFMTYEAMLKKMKGWTPGAKAPRIVVFDESSRLMNPTSQRSQAAMQLANGVRADWGDRGYIWLMTGTPAPKNPANWWHQCEVACPGYLREGNIHLFRQRLAIIHERENPITGGKYPHLVAWRDDVRRCNLCGEMKDHEIHDTLAMHPDHHPWEASKNEVSYLYERMAGLVVVKFKKDCVDLPEKRYEKVIIKPSPSVLRAAKLIADTAPTAIRALTLLRELSDGFQYVEVGTGEMRPCKLCGGTGREKVYVDAEGNILAGEIELDSERFEKLVTCSRCDGSKEEEKTQRSVSEVECPKDAQLITDLENHEEVGRIVIFGGFTGSIDRIERVCRTQGWSVIRMDQGRILKIMPDGTPINIEPIKLFQECHESYPRVAFIGYPGSAGMGLTLTASPTIIYYSNSFDGEARMQSEDRIHRIGMDKQRGATIKDYIHLPSDEHVLTNLKAKRELQSMSMGEIKQVMDARESVASSPAD